MDPKARLRTDSGGDARDTSRARLVTKLRHSFWAGFLDALGGLNWEASKWLFNIRARLTLPIDG
jgi:hypothetical protein